MITQKICKHIVRLNWDADDIENYIKKMYFYHLNKHAYIYINILVLLSIFNDISTFVGYLMSMLNL